MKASATIGVKIAPGAIAFVRILSLPYSKAAFFVIPATACFVATYAVWFRTPLIPPTEATFTILPPPFFCISGITYFIP